MSPTTLPARPIQVLVADDHPMIREGIAALIERHEDIALAGQACNGREAVERFALLRPDVTLMDIQMPEMDGIDATAAIRARWPHARIVILTTHRGDVQALRALRAGASGYLLKSMVHTDLVDAIRSVHAGEKRIPSEVAAELAAHVADDLLSEREVQVLRCVAAGNSNKRVADQLSIGEDTVKAHMKSIMSKLSANDRTHAVTIALKRGIIDV